MIERLTKRDGQLVHTVYIGDFGTQNVLHRLADYEDSGLEPYHIPGILSDNHKIIKECRKLKFENAKLKGLLRTVVEDIKKQKNYADIGVMSRATLCKTCKIRSVTNRICSVCEYEYEHYEEILKLLGGEDLKNE